MTFSDRLLLQIYSLLCIFFNYSSINKVIRKSNTCHWGTTSISSRTTIDLLLDSHPYYISYKHFCVSYLFSPSNLFTLHKSHTLSLLEGVLLTCDIIYVIGSCSIRQGTQLSGSSLRSLLIGSSPYVSRFTSRRSVREVGLSLRSSSSSPRQRLRTPTSSGLEEPPTSLQRGFLVAPAVQNFHTSTLNSTSDRGLHSL